MIDECTLFYTDGQQVFEKQVNCNKCHGWGARRGCWVCGGSGKRFQSDITTEIVADIFKGVDENLMKKVRDRRSQ